MFVFSSKCHKYSAELPKNLSLGHI